MGRQDLRAVIVGAGWAGEGHTLALRQVGVDVVAMCARQSEVVRDVANRLEIPKASTDWRETVHQLKPDIVTIATPASLRGDIVEVAAALGCHVWCEKPLATTAEEARRLCQMIEQAGVKHAFGLTHSVHPTVRWIGDLVRDGSIGTLREFDAAFRLGPWNPPWSWFDTLATGGGMLNNCFTHWLSMLETMTGRRTSRVVGVARPGRERAPVVPGLHDFRTVDPYVLTEEEVHRLEWRACDADQSFSALVSLGRTSPKDGGDVVGSVTATTELAPVGPATGWRLYGDKGVLLVDNLFAPIKAFRQRDTQTERESLPIPQGFLDTAPNSGDDLVDMWTILGRDFVSDIRGEPHSAYTTFHDGWRLQVAIDAIRSGSGWTEVPD